MFELLGDWYVKNTGKGLAIMCVLLLLILMGKWVASSRMEAAAFNRITDSHVSTWDAMWVELRIDRPTSD